MKMVAFYKKEFEAENEDIGERLARGARLTGQLDGLEFVSVEPTEGSHYNEEDNEED